MTKPLSSNNGLKWNIDTLNTLFDSPDGVVSGTNVTSRESFVVPQRRTFTFTATPVTITDTGGANGGHGNLKFYDFPEATITILGAVSNLSISRVSTGLSATAAVVTSVGTVATATSDATLTSTEANVIPSTTATLTAGAGTARGESTAILVADGTSTALDLFLNFAVPDGGISATDSLLVTGTIVVDYLLGTDN